MKQKIDVNSPVEKLDTFLQDNYGHGISKFKLSIFFSYIMYFHSEGTRIQRNCGKRIRELTKLESKIISLIDDYLDNVCFYKSSLKLSKFEPETGISKWTTDIRKSFIIKYFKLGDLLKILERQRDLYCRHMASLEIGGAFHGIESLIRLKPINFLILTWANAMKKRGAVSYVNMSLLITWFSKNLENNRLKDFFSFNAAQDYTQEALRLIYHRYKRSKYNKIAAFNYESIFVREDFKNQYPSVEKRIEFLYMSGSDFSVENMIQGSDLWFWLASLDIIFHYQEMKPINGI